jgi:predicted secreted protein
MRRRSALGFYLNRRAVPAASNHAVSLTTAIAIYFLIWWIMLFAVLPWGVRSQHESGAMERGTDPGAPVLARVWMKLLWTTIASSVVFAILAVVHHYQLVTLDGLAALLGQ